MSATTPAEQGPLPHLDELIPHRGPMSLLDRVVSFDPPGVTCAVTITGDSLFLRDGRVRAIVALEYMAQAAGACTGLTLYRDGKPSLAGFLVSVPKMSFEIDHFEIGDELLVHAAPFQTGTVSGSFDCSVERRGEEVASARLIVLSSGDAS